MYTIVCEDFSHQLAHHTSEDIFCSVELSQPTSLHRAPSSQCVWVSLQLSCVRSTTTVIISHRVTKPSRCRDGERWRTTVLHFALCLAKLTQPPTTPSPTTTAQRQSPLEFAPKRNDQSCPEECCLPQPKSRAFPNSSICCSSSCSPLSDDGRRRLGRFARFSGLRGCIVDDNIPTCCCLRGGR
jgi:hypothetical protein